MITSLPQIYFSSKNIYEPYISIRAIFWIYDKKQCNEIFISEKVFNLISHCFFDSQKLKYKNHLNTFSKKEVKIIRNNICSIYYSVSFALNEELDYPFDSSTFVYDENTIPPYTIQKMISTKESSLIFLKQLLNWIDYAFNQKSIYFSMIEEKHNHTPSPSKKIFAEYMEIKYFTQ